MKTEVQLQKDIQDELKVQQVANDADTGALMSQACQR